MKNILLPFWGRLDSSFHVTNLKFKIVQVTGEQVLSLPLPLSIQNRWASIISKNLVMGYLSLQKPEHQQTRLVLFWILPHVQILEMSVNQFGKSLEQEQRDWVRRCCFSFFLFCTFSLSKKIVLNCLRILIRRYQLTDLEREIQFFDLKVSREQQEPELKEQEVVYILCLQFRARKMGLGISRVVRRHPRRLN